MYGVYSIQLTQAVDLQGQTAVRRFPHTRHFPSVACPAFRSLPACQPRTSARVLGWGRQRSQLIKLPPSSDMCNHETCTQGAPVTVLQAHSWGLERDFVKGVRASNTAGVGYKYGGCDYQILFAQSDCMQAWISSHKKLVQDYQPKHSVPVFFHKQAGRVRARIQCQLSEQWVGCLSAQKSS